MSSYTSTYNEVYLNGTYRDKTDLKYFIDEADKDLQYQKNVLVGIVARNAKNTDEVREIIDDIDQVFDEIHTNMYNKFRAELMLDNIDTLHGDYIDNPDWKKKSLDWINKDFEEYGDD